MHQNRYDIAFSCRHECRSEYSRQVGVYTGVTLYQKLLPSEHVLLFIIVTEIRFMSHLLAFCHSEKRVKTAVYQFLLPPYQQ
jgi:hypothetical protein